MSIRFVAYTEEQTDAVRSFNQRLRAGGMKMQFPVEVVPAWLPPGDHDHLFQEQYVALDATGQVRGGYILKHQEFRIGDDDVSIADLRLPISEGSIDREYASIATELLFNALSKQRLLFGMGIGGYDEAIAKLFQAAGWHVFTIPFHFKVHHPFRFCRRIQFLRRTWPRRLALDIAAYSGTAAVGINAVQAWRSRRPITLDVEVVDHFDRWADELWERCRADYSMMAVRDCDALQSLYPRWARRFIRLRFSDRQRVVGWVVLLDTQMHNHKQFGSLRVGSVVDALAAKEHASAVVAAATRYLESSGVDLLVANHSHRTWCAAFRKAGFVQGPSNYLYASSRALTKRFRQAEVSDDQTYLTRGDGDGPINL